MTLRILSVELLMDHFDTLKKGNQGWLFRCHFICHASDMFRLDCDSFARLVGAEEGPDGNLLK